MNMLNKLNEAIQYIENNLCEEIDLDEMAKIACVSKDSFKRFFSYMAGVTPIQARKHNGSLKAYLPASFHIIIKGATEMDVKIIETKTIKLKGISSEFTGEAANRFEQEELRWAEHNYADYGEVCVEPYGDWYGIWNNGRYTIAKLCEEVFNKSLEETEIPAGTYAVFKSGVGGYAGIEIPKLREMIFNSWLQDSNYIQVGDCEIEVYHLYPKCERQKRYYELWIPVELKR